MDELTQLRAEVLDAFREVLASTGPEMSSARRQLVISSRDKLAAGRYLVVVCGEFKRGKSSLLNSLVERPGLFPVDVMVATSAITTLQWGDADTAVLYFNEDPGSRAAPEPVQIPLASAADYVTERGNPGNAKNVDRIEMAAPIPQLRTGLVLVDTPGLGSINPAHSVVARAFMPHADGILFVVSATEPLGVAELDFLTMALEQCPVIVTAVTMIDRLVDPTPAVAAIRSRIGERTGRNPDGLVLVGVSSPRKRRALQMGDEELLSASGFPELEDALWQGLAMTCGRMQILQAVADLDSAVGDAAAPFANALAALSDDSEIRAVEAELRAAQESTRKLRSRGSRWRSDLKAELRESAKVIRRRMAGEFDAIEGYYRQAQADGLAAEDPGTVIREISERMVDAVNRANITLMAAAEKTARRFSRITSTRLIASNVSPDFAPPERSTAVASVRETRSWVRLSGALSGATIGAALGTIVAPVVGTILGAALGGLIGQIASWGTRAERDAATVGRSRTVVVTVDGQAMISASLKRALDDFELQVAECVTAMTTALDRELEADADSQEQSVRRLADLHSQNVRERELRAGDLSATLSRYSALRDRLGMLRARAETLGSGMEQAPE
jgi:uncharacterized membrane protein